MEVGNDVVGFGKEAVGRRIGEVLEATAVVLDREVLFSSAEVIGNTIDGSSVTTGVAVAEELPGVSVDTVDVMNVRCGTTTNLLDEANVEAGTVEIVLIGRGVSSIGIGTSCGASPR